MIKKSICELFAGVGGFRLGLEKSSKDWETVWFNQWEPNKKQQHAYNCYVSHFGKIDGFNNTNDDISTVEKKTIPDHNLLVGGFPCQDYSVARSLSGNTGIEGKKGVLWWEIRDIVECKEPPFIILENVDRLLKSPATQRGRDFGIMLTCLNNLGYGVEWRVVNAADYGAGQRRRRTFIFAYKLSTLYGKSMKETTDLKFLNVDGFFAKAFPIEVIEQGEEQQFESSDLVEVTENFRFEFENAGCMRNGKIFTAKVTPIYETPTQLRSLLESGVSEKYYLGEVLDKWQYLKGAKKIQRTSKTGHSYVFSEGAIAFPDPIDKPARTMLTSESSLNRSTHVIQDPETMKYRLITPVEAERIQGFDDEWTNTGMPEKFRYFCMGNALVVSIVERMGKVLNDIFAKEN